MTEKELLAREREHKKKRELFDVEYKAKYGIRSDIEKILFAYAYLYIHQEIDDILQGYYLKVVKRILPEKSKKPEQIETAKILKMIPAKYWDDYKMINNIRNDEIAHDPSGILNKIFPK